ncbi:hypothetical protein LRS74_28855 [Streptomyces sp. LX-29]|uniref:hypothetical protein n=1 Tax=Streptomyces sp. LX-29 TaxID=2900152 RepID=UPI00240D41CE|nr:hypothetical protein [Streptomyces sp. LX-29]WFB10596.1 hypothetical protein LRS74_28855 [Streptomyces sp. LX-29]
MNVLTKKTSARRLIRLLLTLGALTAMTVPAAAAGAVESGPDEGARQARGGGCVVAYFDLGETLVHSAADGSMRYAPGAAEHLRALRARHIPVGLITNVPSSWGATDAERAAALRKVVDEEWTDSTPFAWSDFDGRILTPRTEAERKPAPVLWERAREAAGDCRVVFQGENAEEVRTAGSLGYVAYQVAHAHRPAYLPPRLIALLAHLP